MHATTTARSSRSPVWPACTLLLAALTSCRAGPADEQTASRRLARARLALVGPAGPAPDWPAVRDAFHDALRPYRGLKIELVRPRHTGGPALRDVLESLNRRSEIPDAVVVAVPPGIDPARFVMPAVRRQRVVVLIGPRKPPEGAYGVVRVAWAAGAELLARSLAHAAPHARSYLLLHRRRHGVWHRRLYDRFMLAARARTELALLDEADLDAGPSAADVLTRLTARFPHAGLLVSLDGSIWRQRDVLEAVRPTLPVATLGFGLGPDAWPLMRSGRISAFVAPVAGRIGAAAAEMTAAGLADGDAGPHVRTVACELVTPPQLDAFIRRYMAAATGTVAREP